MHNSTVDGASGPFWVVLGGSDAVNGIWANQRPRNTAVGRYPFLLPIVVICKTYDDAESVNALNTELFDHVADDDYHGLAQAIRTSRTVATLLTHCASRFYSFRVSSEPGIYVSHTWDEVEKFAAFSGSKYQGFDTFVQALLFMIEKEPFKSNAAPPAGPSERVAPAVQPVAATAAPSAQTASFSGAAPWLFAGAYQSASARGGAASAPGPRVKVEPSGSSGFDRRVHGAREESPRASPVKVTSRPGNVGASVRVPIATGSNTRAAYTDEDHLAAFMQLMFSGLPAETRALRSLVSPLPSQDPQAGRGPPLTFGQRADAYLRVRGVPATSYLVVLQARLYSPNAYAFGYTLHHELGWAQGDGVELWDLIELPCL